MTFCGDVPMRAFHYVLCVKKVEHVNTYLYQYYYDQAERILARQCSQMYTKDRRSCWKRTDGCQRTNVCGKEASAVCCGLRSCCTDRCRASWLLSCRCIPFTEFRSAISNAQASISCHNLRPHSNFIFAVRSNYVLNVHVKTSVPA